MSVSIQCPNGRRQTMKVKPNTNILEILEYVCEKQGFNPKEYELSRNNKILDLSLTIRFANIPNNGQLDLKKSTVVRKDEKVLIAMELEDGNRQINEFDSNHNLWEIIHSLFENNPILNLEQNMEFSIVYVQKEISGETQLKQTNLKSLGLVQGRAAIKLLVRPINATKEQAFVVSLDLKKFAEKSESNKKTKKMSELEDKQGLTNVVPKTEPTVQSKQQIVDNKPIETNESNKEVIVSQQLEKSKNEIIEQKSEDSQQMEISSDESSDESQEILNYLGGNNAEIVFKMSDLPKASKKDFPDEFYETTRDDLMHVLNDLRQQQVANSLKSLETKQMREQKRKEQMNKYNSTVIRVCFPYDKLVFQAIFKPTDKVEDVKKVVALYTSSLDFHLYTVPPKNILSSESSLLDLGLVPAAVIHFGNNASENQQNVIKDEFKLKLSSYKSAAKIATEVRNACKRTADTSMATQTNTSGHTSQISTENRSSDQKSKLPKWFKTNK